MQCVWFQCGRNLFDGQIEKPEVNTVKPDNRANRKRDIDENLRRVFEETLDEGIPDRFKDLLNQLKSQENGQEDKK